MNSEESNKLIAFKIRKSNQSIKAAQLLIENNFYNEAINRIYYACFYLVSALLHKNNINAKTHAGVKTMLHKNFTLTNLIDEELAAFYSSIFFFRHSSDYEEGIEYEKEVTIGLYKEAISFLDSFQNLLNHS